MQWLFEYQGLAVPHLSEREVDCYNCQVHLPLKREKNYDAKVKCCDFSPFVSCFSLGALVHSGVDLIPILEGSRELAITVLGVVHSHKHRKQKQICHFYSDGNCEIWSQRPPICYTFYCASRKTQVLQSLEEHLLTHEAQLLHKWFQHLQLDESLWRQWGDCMDETPGAPIPEDLLLGDWNEAYDLFLKSYNWLQEQK